MSDYLNFLNENQTYNDLNDYASQAQQTFKDVSEQIKDSKIIANINTHIIYIVCLVIY